MERSTDLSCLLSHLVSIFSRNFLMLTRRSLIKLGSASPSGAKPQTRTLCVVLAVALAGACSGQALRALPPVKPC